MTSICSVPGCEREVRARSMCKKHWTRWRRHGDPLAVSRRGSIVDPTPFVFATAREGAVAVEGHTPLRCETCGEVVAAKPDELTWQLIADARYTHSRYCGRDA